MPSDVTTQPGDDSLESGLRALVHAPAVDPDQFLERHVGRDLAAGTVLDDTFVVERVLGRGGMGIVYLARHDALDRHVAIKLHLPGRSPAHTDRLLREARATAALNHPNIVVVHHVGEFSGQVFIVMEYAPGGTLTQWLAAERRGPDVIVAKFIEAARGLAAAHAHGFVHRDFKSDNVLIGADGRARVGDFGLVTLLRDHPSASGETNPDSVRSNTSIAGTLRFMAPEQHTRGEITAAADQFALCVALFEALSGVHPFAGRSSAEIATSVVTGRRTDAALPVSARVRRAIERGLATDPTQRHASVDALIVALSPRRRWLVLPAVLGATVVGAGVVLAGPSSAPPSPCQTARVAVPAWTADDRQRVRDAFDASELQRAAWLGDRVVRTLDEQHQRWLDAERAVCMAAQREDATIDGRDACLRASAAEFRTVVALLGNGATGALARSLELVGHLGSPQRCAATEPPERLGATGQRSTAFETSLADARTALRAALLDDAWAHATEALTMAADRRETAEARVLRARIAKERRDYSGATLEGETAVQLAIAIGANDVASESATAMVFVAGVGDSDLAEAQRWAALARAWGSRTSDPLPTQITVGLQLGLAHREARKFDVATQALRKALDQASALQPPRPELVVAAKLNLATTLKVARRFDEAEPLVRDALQTVELEFGRDHPKYADGLGVLATILRQTDRGSEAVVLAEEVLQRRQVEAGPASPTTGEAHYNLGAVLRAAGRAPESTAHIVRALEIFEATGQRNLERKTLRNLVVTAMQDEELDDALRYAKRSLARSEDVANRTVLARALTDLAHVLTRRGEQHDALRIAKRAIEVGREAYEPDDPLRVAGLLLSASIAQQLEKHDVARAQYAQAREDLLRTETGRDHPYWHYAQTGYAKALVEGGRAAEALPILEATVLAVGPSHELSCQLNLALAVARAKTRDGRGALAALGEAERAAATVGGAAEAEACSAVRAQLRSIGVRGR